MTDELRRQGLQQLSAMVSAGVRHFPKPVPSALGVFDVPVVEFEKQVLGCTLCPLSKDRLRVVANDPAKALGHARYLAVADFAELADEAAAKPFSEDGQGAVLLRLFEKLGISEQIFKSYAVKCAPRKGIPAGAVAICSTHLKHEFETLRPEAVLLFGSRAKRAFELAAGENLAAIDEVGRMETRSALVFVMPSVGELATYPEWRGTVWRLLQPLRSQL